MTELAEGCGDDRTVDGSLLNFILSPKERKGWGHPNPGTQPTVDEQTYVTWITDL